jgi:hypothetical protein
MEFESLDAYLLDGTPPKADVVRQLLENRPREPAAAAFYEGFERLGARTPDLALIALRLVLAGVKADDAAVTRARDLIARVHARDPTAREEYRALVRSPE